MFNKGKYKRIILKLRQQTKQMPDKNIGFSVGTGILHFKKKLGFVLTILQNHDKTTPLSVPENIPPELAGQGIMTG